MYIAVPSKAEAGKITMQLPDQTAGKIKKTRDDKTTLSTLNKSCKMTLFSYCLNGSLVEQMNYSNVLSTFG